MRGLMYLFLIFGLIDISSAMEISSGDSLEFNGRTIIHNGKEKPFSCPYNEIKSLEIDIEGAKFLVDCKKGVVYITQGKDNYLILGGGSHNDMTSKVFATKLVKNKKWVVHQKIFSITENYDVCISNYLGNKEFCDNYKPTCTQEYHAYRLEGGAFVPMSQKQRLSDFIINSFLSQKEIKKRCKGTYNFKRDYKLLQKAKNRVPGS